MPMRTNVFTSVYTSIYMTSRTQREAGFTFIDVMLALVILTIGVLALADLQVISSSGNKASQGLTTAASLGAAKLEAIKNTPYAGVSAEAATPITGADGTTYTRRVTVTNNSPMTNTKTVTVTLTWTDGSRTTTIPMSTVIAQ
jgi:type IV pilus assembly protein PilV